MRLAPTVAEHAFEELNTQKSMLCCMFPTAQITQTLLLDWLLLVDVYFFAAL